MKLYLISLFFLLASLVSADVAPWKFKLLYDSDYIVTTSYRHGKFAYRHDRGLITFSTQHNRSSSLGEFLILKEELKKKNLSFAIEPLDEKLGLTCESGSSEKMRDLINVCHGLVIRELDGDEKRQIQKLKINNPVTKKEPFRIAYNRHQMRTESTGMDRFLARESLGKFYVNTADDDGKVRSMWLPKEYQEKFFTIMARTSSPNFRINCHYSPLEDLAPEQCEGDISLYGLNGNSPDLPSAEENKAKFIFDHDFVISESFNQEKLGFHYYQFNPLLDFLGYGERTETVGGSLTLRDDEKLHNSLDYKDATLSVAVEISPKTDKAKDVDCKKDSSEAYRSSIIYCSGKSLARELNNDEKREIEKYKNSVKGEKNPFKIVFDNGRVKSYSADLAWFQVDTFSLNATTFFKILIRDYVKYEPNPKEHSLSFEVPESNAKKEFVVERASKGTECKHSPLRDLITDCEGAISVRALKEEEKLR